jgi:SAM-dependent methyltransferase
MEAITCILCGSLSSHVAITENGYKGLKCQKCGLIYISPRPNAAEVRHLYEDHQAIKYADAQFQFEGFKRIEAARTLSKIRQFKRRGSILELGAGGGFFLLEARNYGYESYGIELNPIEALWINHNLNIPCETEPLSKHSFDGYQFDIIYHKDVLSHLHDPIGIFSDINRALKKEGLLVFETRNIADVKEEHYKWFSQFSYPDHLFFFGEKSLGILLERTGFKCIRVYKDAILLQLFLQKVLWRIKDRLKEKEVLVDMRSQKSLNPVTSKQMSVKRRLRSAYRYMSYFLIKLGAVLPKNGWPLKLLVIAQKK